MNPVRTDARSVAAVAVDVRLNPTGIRLAALTILDQLISEPYTTSKWLEAPLHPVVKFHSISFILNWIFLVSSLNFSFWTDRSESERYGVRWKTGVDGKGDALGGDKIWTGYYSLLAALHRAIAEGIDITNPAFYSTCDEAVVRHVFRSDQEEEMPLLDERIRVMRQVGSILCKTSYQDLLRQANGSALSLMHLITSTFSCYNDVAVYNDEQVSIQKRAQILIAETWAAFDGEGVGYFQDVDQITMFADYRVPQILHSLDTITYSPHLTSHLLAHANLDYSQREEVEIRMCSIAAVEAIREEIARLIQERGLTLEPPNSILIDFYLWDAAKVAEADGRAVLPHHRTRSIFY